MLISTLEQPTFLSALRSAWAEHRRVDDSKELARQVTKLEAQRERLHHLITKAVTRFVSGEIDRPSYDIASARLQADVDAVQKELDRLSALRLEPDLPDLDEVLRTLRVAGGWTKILHDSDLGARRKVLACLIERVQPIRRGYGKYDVDITWTAVGKLLYATGAQRPEGSSLRPAS